MEGSGSASRRRRADMDLYDRLMRMSPEEIEEQNQKRRRARHLREMKEEWETDRRKDGELIRRYEDA